MHLVICFYTFLAKDPCQQNSIGCKHICFLSGGVEKCSCRPGYALQQDGKTCTGMCATCLRYIYQKHNNNNKDKDICKLNISIETGIQPSTRCNLIDSQGLHLFCQYLA